MKRLLLLIALVASCTSAVAAASMAWPIQISLNGRYFVDQKGQPVFWLGTTQWELFRGYTLEDARLILDKSKDKGFVFVQTMLLGVGDGTRANVSGQKPWLHDDPRTPNEAYFRNVDAVIQAARERDMILYVMLYHQTCRKHITVDNAHAWAKWLAQRYKEMPHIVWSLTPEAKPEFVPILRELAAGLREGDGGAHLITVEPDPSPYSSSFIHSEKWLDFNSLQTWKGVELIYPRVTHDYDLEPVKPVLMAEGAYEQGSEYGFDVTPLWIRRQAYYSYLAGGHHAYGHNDSWRILPTWKQALDAPGARQMGILRRVFEARPEWWRLAPDQSLFAVGGQTKGRVLHLAARPPEGKWAMIYLADPAEFSVNLARLQGPHVSASWIDPATGESVAVGSYANAGVQLFTTPAGWEDSLLILESAEADAASVPPGAATLGYTKCVINEKPTAADVAPGRNGDYKWFSGQWWHPKKPSLSRYSTQDGVLALGLGGDLVSAPHDFSTGKLPLLPGRDGFYVEFEYWLSDADPDHFPAVWLMPAEHNGARPDHYADDPPGYERWMELDVDEGGFGPGLTGTVHSHYGIYEQGYQHIQSPNNVSRVALDRTRKHTFGASYDPQNQTVAWWLDGAKQMSAGSPHVPDVGAGQSFYLIISAQSHGKQKPYSLFVSGVRAYVPPSSLLPAWKSETQANLPGTGAAAAEVRPEGRDSAALAAAIQRSETGTTIRLPEGTFELTDSVRLKSGVKLIGSGQDKTVFIYAGDQPAPFVNLTDCENVEIAHLTLDGRLRPLGQDGIRAGNCRRLWLHHLTIRNLVKGKSSFVQGIIFSGHNPTMERGVTDSIISDCRIEKIGLGAEYGGGIRMAWGSVRNRMERNIIRDTGRGGIFGDHSAELVIRNNQVSGSGGEGLGIEIWGGCPRSLVEDNVVDHWISVDQGNQSAVRRNVVGVEDASLKGFGIEIIASDVVVTDNLVKRGASVGLSVSNKPKKNNVFWGYNTIRECVQWGAQLQGETGGIAHHYFYHCSFEKTIRGDPRARYPQDSGHGFRFNGSSRALVFEECAFRDNGGYGVQFGGPNVDGMTFLRCVFANNRQGLVTGLSADKTVEFKDGTAGSDKAGAFPPTKAFSSAPPAADFRMPPVIRAGAAAPFECTSKSGAGEIVERLWDFNHGIAEVVANPQHTFDQPGKYRVTLIVWDAAGRGARAEKVVEVLPAK